MSPQGLLVLVAHVLALLTAGIEVTQGLRFPFGASAGDTGHLTQSTLAVKVPLPTPFTYYGEAHADIYANEDGFLSFTRSGVIFDVDKDFDAVPSPVICLFCADFNPRNDRKVWRRLSTQAADLQKVQDLARRYHDFGATFTPTWVFVVTWDAVGTFDPNKGGNTLQIAVANNAAASLVYMEYDAINWVEGFTGTDNNVHTKVGFTKGDNKSYYAFPQSQSINITNLTTSSNIGVDGEFLFRVDQNTISEMLDPVTTTIPPTTTPTTTIPTTTTPTTTVPTTNPATTTATIPNTTEDAAIANTSSTLRRQPASSQWPVEATTIGVGVSLAALLLTGIVAFVVVRGKGRGAVSSVPCISKVAPAPPTVVSEANCLR